LRSVRAAIPLLIFLVCASDAAGQQGRGRAAPPRPPAPAAAPGPITQATLGQLLRDAGYTPTQVTEAWYTIPVDILGASKYPLDVSLSESGEKLWLHVHLGSVQDAARVPPAALARLLQLNDAGPAHFIFRRCETCAPLKDKLYMTLTLDNRGVSPPLFKATLEKFIEEIRATRDAWLVQRWPK
jgi:hypothetical protein